ncbi:hypothetical protein HDF26_002349 [Pedobacter cryoconitis]|uniref:hypothetical protein n=1 Tax=Pedobacter cryoconitis TaxID=188932 RepID=UPI0017BA8B6C|nr:hypothetical protein [Pedobacter cryoconitis]MBB6271892.1 hypothetical protein [Pedobacter cryoconitis]
MISNLNAFERAGVFHDFTDYMEEHSQMNYRFVTSGDLRASSALLVAGIYYLVLHAKSTDTLFCEIDLKTSAGIERIRKAVKLILEKMYN